ncbi:MAG: lamin tail domain-containing protein [Myxococcales bacterium]|nr:lamin tail domain-containing protein [Myxococcales bacterium]
MRRMLWLLALAGCNPDPGEIDQQVGYRDGLEDGQPNSGERGTVVITEVLWSGSVTNDGRWDARDVFVEIKNESARTVNLSGWRLQVSGVRMIEWQIPASDRELDVGEHAFVAAKDDGCLLEPDWLLPELSFTYGEPFQVTLRDADERLMEPAGSRTAPPFAGGYDGVVSRSMEKVELMFGGRGSEPHSWHFYTDAEVDVPNDDRVAESCRQHTKASPGRPNSPDYSGAFATGSFE